MSQKTMVDSKTQSQKQVVSDTALGFKVIQVQRFGEDRGTVYKVSGIQ